MRYEQLVLLRGCRKYLRLPDLLQRAALELPSNAVQGVERCGVAYLVVVRFYVVSVIVHPNIGAMGVDKIHHVIYFFIAFIPNSIFDQCLSLYAAIREIFRVVSR